MSNHIAAADAVRASIKQFKQLASFADALENLGSIEQAVTENTAKLEALHKEVSLVQGNITIANAQLENALKQAEQVKAEGKAVLDLAVKQASDTVFMAKQNAIAEGKTIVEKAQAKSHELVAQAELKVSDAQAKEAEILTATKQADELLQDKQRELISLETKINEIKSQASRLLG
jgi:hypothetical protein